MVFRQVHTGPDPAQCVGRPQPSDTPDTRLRTARNPYAFEANSVACGSADSSGSREGIHVKYLDGELPDGHSKSGGIPDKYLINTWKIPATCKNTCLKNRRIKVVLKVVLKVFNIYADVGSHHLL